MKPIEQKYHNGYKFFTGMLALIVLILLISMYGQESLTRSWKQYQTTYRQAILDSARNERQKLAAGNMAISIHEIKIPDLDLTDRCTTCHTGVSDAVSYLSGQPYGKHSGKWLELHSTEKFACTLCHGGRGRALDEAVAHSRETAPPFMTGNEIQSNCAKCHLSVFTADDLPTGMNILAKGRSIVQDNGCLGCHKIRGTGGLIGPDLTRHGEKPPGAYYFEHVSGPKTVANWLDMHFSDPDTVSPGSIMPEFNFSADSLEALRVLVRGLWGPQLPFRYYNSGMIREYKNERDLLSGKQAYNMLCSACHGKNGKGRDYQNTKFGVPHLNNQDFLALASEQFILFTLDKGRANRMMGAWTMNTSGVHRSELDQLNRFIQNWRQPAADFARTRTVTGNHDRGRVIYQEICAMCHGTDGTGDLGPGLNRPAILAATPDRFLFDAITKGRANTAMPAWARLDNGQMADLISYIRGWQKGNIKLTSANIEPGNIARGDSLYLYKCSRCHGRKGTGGIGPAILNPAFLDQANDVYLYTIIANGRDHSPMFGMGEHASGSGQNIRQPIYDLISFMRSRQRTMPPVTEIGASLGNAAYGKILYRRFCSECHGDQGQGEKAPALNNQEFLNAASDGFILGTISLGRTGTAMPVWGKGNDNYPALSVQDRRDITSFIRGWQKIKIPHLTAAN